MPLAPANAAGIEIFYETYGDPEGVPLLFVMGLGAQLHVWDMDLVDAFVDRGFFAIRFDNRDVGLSTKPDVGPVNVVETVLAAFGGAEVSAPYLLSDMAADAVSLLDHLSIPAAHVLGASMGGMIAQSLAINHPERVLTLTSVMSTTGDPDVGMPQPEVVGELLNATPTDRAGAIAAGVASSKVISGPHFDPERAEIRAATSYDRCFYPVGVGHQLLAVVASGSRAEGLRNLDVPTLVIHGEVDPLVTVSGGIRTAELIPGAELIIVEEMGHDVAPHFWPQLVEATIALTARVPANAD